MDEKVINPFPNLQIIEKQSLSTKKERKKCFTNFDRPPKAPVRSCPVSRTRQKSLFDDSCPRPVSFKDESNLTLITDNPMYTSKNSTYFEQCFTMESTLGKGSFGEVFKVFSKETGETYACKRTILKYRGQSDRNRRIQEVKKHEQLPTHLNCVEFYRAWEEKNHLYLLTEVCQSSLADVMANTHEIPEKQMWSFLVDILQGLNHLHEHKLIHMDVKPENIFLGMDGLCKLGDFGLVVDFSKGFPSEAVEGDPKYLAPECLQNVYSPAADVFSLGIVLLEMATDLFLPQAGPQWHELRKGFLPEVAQRKMSADFQYVVKGFINPDPNQRFTTKKVLLEFKPIYRIVMRKKVSQVARGTITTANKEFQSLLLWLWTSFLLVVSMMSLGKLKPFLPHSVPTNMDAKKTLERDKELFDHSDDELVCNLSYGDLTEMDGPLTNSTPISHVKRKVFLPRFGGDLETSESNAYSFNESSFSSLEMSNEESLRQNSREESKVNPRNLLLSFNSATYDDD